MNIFHNITIDIETLSSSSDALMISLGAACRAPDGELATFEMPIQPNTFGGKLSIDPNTVMWWLQQSQEARESVVKPGEIKPLLFVVCEQFNKWILQMAQGAKPRLWGNAASFDNVILRHNYNTAGVNPAWGFREDMCYRTLKNLYPEILFEKPAIAHKASSDALAQHIHLEKILKHMRGYA